MIKFEGLVRNELGGRTTAATNFVSKFIVFVPSNLSVVVLFGSINSHRIGLLKSSFELANDDLQLKTSAGHGFIT